MGVFAASGQAHSFDVQLPPECPHCIELHTHAARKGCNQRASARQPKSARIKERKK
jgi:hypothetical protein